METHLSDMIIPEVFGNYVLNTALKTNRFVQSGILTPDPDLGPHLLEAGTKITVPFINDLSGDPDNWTDTDDIPVDQLTSGKQLGSPGPLSKQRSVIALQASGLALMRKCY